MSIASEITRINTNIANSYTAVDGKGGILPETQNSANLATAINSIEVIETATAEGESLSLTNTKAMPYNDYVVKGKSEQATRSGIQLIKEQGLSTPKTNTTFWNSADNEFTPLTNGWGKVEYDNTNGSEEKYINTMIKLNGVKLETNKNYTIILEIRNISYTGTARIRLCQGRTDEAFSTSISPIDLNSTLTTLKFLNTTKSDFTNVTMGLRMFFVVWANSKASFEVRASIVEGDYTSITYNYEPYGVSPSPDYPSDINSVADDVNLFDVITATANQSNYVLNNDGTITNNKSWGNDGRTFFNNILLNAGTHIISYVPNLSGTTKNIRFSIKNIDSSTDIINQSISITNLTKQTYSFSLSSNTNIAICIMPNGVNDGTLTLDDIKLQKGSTSTPYSPYNQGTVTIKQRGKNEINLNRTLGTPSNASYDASSKRLFNYNNYIIGITSNNYYLTSKISSYNVQNNTIKVEVNGSGYGVGFPIKLKPNTSYILSYDTDLEANQNSGIGFYKSDGTYISNINSLLTNNYINFTTPSNCDFAVIIFRPPVNTELTYRNIQLEEGSTATVYEPYQTPHDYTIQTEPLRSLPNGVKDTIEADGIHRRVGRVVLDGSEGWRITTNLHDGFVRYYISGYNIGSTSALSDYFLVKDTTSTSTENILECRTNGSILINTNVATTLEDFKTWLSTHNTEVLYELAEEVIEPLTQNQATTYLDIIKTGSYEGTTNIYTDEDVKPTTGVGYYKKA